MGFVTTFLIGFALAMDAFAVSITKGITLRKINTALSFKIAFFFGLFQGFMPFIGWLVGIRFQSYITFIDHWIALFLLSFIVPIVFKNATLSLVEILVFFIVDVGNNIF